MRHIVALRFREGAPDTVKQAPHADLAGQKTHIDGIVDFRGFTDASFEPPLMCGLGDLFRLNFPDVAVRDASLAGAGHQATGARIDGVFVADVAP